MSDVSIIVIGVLSVILFVASLAMLMCGDWKKPVNAVLIMLCIIGACGLFYATFARNEAVIEEYTEKYKVVGFEVVYTIFAETDVAGDAPAGKLPKKTVFVVLEQRHASEVWYTETSDPDVFEVTDNPSADCKKMTLITKKVKKIKVGSASVRNNTQKVEDLHVKCKYSVGDTVNVRGNRIVR